MPIMARAGGTGVSKSLGGKPFKAKLSGIPHASRSGGPEVAIYEQPSGGAVGQRLVRLADDHSQISESMTGEASNMERSHNSKKLSQQRKARENAWQVCRCLEVTD